MHGPTRRSVRGWVPDGSAGMRAGQNGHRTEAGQSPSRAARPPSPTHPLQTHPQPHPTLDPTLNPTPSHSRTRMALSR